MSFFWRVLGRCSAICLLASAIWAEPATAATDAVATKATGPENTPKRPRIGLVLSGGGARGLAHVGVLKVLEREHIPIDVIAGTSMGAIVGGLYATGMDAATLEEELLKIKWNEIFASRVERALLPQRRKDLDFQLSPALEFGMRDGELRAPLGALSGQGLETLLRRYTLPALSVREFSKLPIPFRAVATDMETGQPVILDSGDLALALRSSMSVPGVFAPTEANDRILGDGGLVNNLPIDVARQMGADIVIAVNIGTPLSGREALSSLGGLTSQMVSILTEQNVQRSLATLGSDDVLITPTLGQLTSGDFNRTREFIDQGEAGVRPALARLSGLALSPDDYTAWKASISRLSESPTKLAFIRFETTQLTNPQRLADQLELAPGKLFDREKAERDALRLAASGDYSRSDFRLINTPQGDGLVYLLEDKPWGPNYFRVGLDLFTDLSGTSAFNLKFSHTRRWLDQAGTEWRNYVQLGDTLRLFSEIYKPLNWSIGLSRDWFLAAGADFKHSQLTLYAPNSDTQQGRFDEKALKLGLDLGQPWGELGEMRVGVQYLGIANRPELISADFSGPTTDLNVHEFGLRISAVVDQLDYVNFPQRGYRAAGEAVLGKRAVSGTAGREGFTRVELESTAAKTWGAFTTNAYLNARSAGGKDLTGLERYSYQLGGFQNLSGYRYKQLAGSHVLFGRLTAYQRVSDAPLLTRGVFVGGSLEAGNAWAQASEVSLSDLRLGTSLFVGADTALGPLYFGATYAPRGQAGIYLFLGRP
jgi:NTE family protein